MNELTIRALGAFQGTSELPESMISQLQTKLAEWQRRNFVELNASDSALGIVEEIGEFFNARNYTARFDAVGDTLVFACQLASVFKLDMGTILHDTLNKPSTFSSNKTIYIAIGTLAHVILKSQSGIRGFDDSLYIQDRICSSLLILCHELFNKAWDVELDEALLTVGTQVLARDWVANPLTGKVAE